MRRTAPTWLVVAGLVAWSARWKQALNPAHVHRADAVTRALLGQR